MAEMDSNLENNNETAENKSTCFCSLSSKNNQKIANYGICKILIRWPAAASLIILRYFLAAINIDDL
jgi:hypothetical protein